MSLFGGWLSKDSTATHAFQKSLPICTKGGRGLPCCVPALNTYDTSVHTVFTMLWEQCLTMWLFLFSVCPLLENKLPKYVFYSHTGHEIKCYVLFRVLKLHCHLIEKFSLSKKSCIFFFPNSQLNSFITFICVNVCGYTHGVYVEFRVQGVHPLHMGSKNQTQVFRVGSNL